MPWTQATAATWVARNNFGHAVHDGKLWIVGGFGNNYPTAPVQKNDVWFSADGFSWSQATAAAAWSARSGQRCVTFAGKLWMVTSDLMNREIWNSPDGSTWTLVTASPSFTARVGFLLLVFGGKLWVIGGFSAGFPQNDVWNSTNGVTWTLVPPTTSLFAARRDMAGAVMDGKLWLFGGNIGTAGMFGNDVWSSSDGAAWTQITPAAAWPARHAHRGFASSTQIWVSGGIVQNASYADDAWYSNDGSFWVRTNDPKFNPSRGFHGAQFFLNKAWVYGGLTSSTAQYLRDVWYYEDATKALKVRWADRESVGKLVHFRWKVARDYVFQRTKERWADRSAVGKSVHLRWHIGGPVGATLHVRWGLPSALSKRAQIRWKINPQNVGRSARMRWGIRKPIARVPHFRWAIGLDCAPFEFVVTGATGIRTKSATGLLNICTE